MSYYLYILLDVNYFVMKKELLVKRYSVITTIKTPIIDVQIFMHMTCFRNFRWFCHVDHVRMA